MALIDYEREMEIFLDKNTYIVFPKESRENLITLLNSYSSYSKRTIFGRRHYEKVKSLIFIALDKIEKNIPENITISELLDLPIDHPIKAGVIACLNSIYLACIYYKKHQTKNSIKERVCAIEILGQNVLILKKKIEKTSPVGICNLGVSCFLNATVQQLYRNKNFRNQVLNSDIPEDIKSLLLEPIQNLNEYLIMPKNMGDGIMHNNNKSILVLYALQCLFIDLKSKKKIKSDSRLMKIMKILGYRNGQEAADEYFDKIQSETLRAINLTKNTTNKFNIKFDLGSSILLSNYYKITIQQLIASYIQENFLNTFLLNKNSPLTMKEKLNNFIMDQKTSCEILQNFDLTKNTITKASPIYIIIRDIVKDSHFRLDEDKEIKQKRCQLFINALLDTYKILSPKNIDKILELSDSIKDIEDFYIKLAELPDILLNQRLPNHICNGDVINIRVTHIGEGSFIGDIEQLKIGGQTFNLISTVVHWGSESSGHYTNYVKKGGKWYYISDNFVEQVEFKDIENNIKTKATILSYRK